MQLKCAVNKSDPLSVFPRAVESMPYGGPANKIVNLLTNDLTAHSAIDINNAPVAPDVININVVEA